MPLYTLSKEVAHHTPQYHISLRTIIHVLLPTRPTHSWLATTTKHMVHSPCTQETKTMNSCPCRPHPSIFHPLSHIRSIFHITFYYTCIDMCSIHSTIPDGRSRACIASFKSNLPFPSLPKQETRPPCRRPSPSVHTALPPRFLASWLIDPPWDFRDYML